MLIEVLAILERNLYCNEQKKIAEIENTFQLTNFPIKNQLYTAVIKTLCLQTARLKRKEEILLEEAKNKYASLQSMVFEKNQELIAQKAQYETEISKSQQKFNMEIAEKNKKVSIYYFKNNI